MRIATGSRNMLMAYVWSVSLIGILCSGNSMTEEVRKLVEKP